jgi:alpha 1,2-mannosyltransferase
LNFRPNHDHYIVFVFASLKALARKTHRPVGSLGEMRWSQPRLIAAIILIFVITNLLLWNRGQAPDYLPGDGEAYKNESPKSLASVLQEFVQRPILSYEQSTEWNAATCPTEGINIDEGSVRENEQKWRELPSTQISNWRHEIAAYLYSKQEEHEKMNSEIPAARVREGGRGIVLSAGDHDAVIRAQTNIRLLRSYNCTLPVEIFHFASELSAEDKNLLSALSKLELSDGHGDMNVTIRVVEGIEKSKGWKAFEIKGAAIQQCSYDEILYLDTDSYPLRNPETLFESKYWKETGLFLYPDYTKSHPTNPLWRLLGQQCRNEYEGESGQILISRSRHQDVLWLVEYFALHHWDFYGFMGGDRDSFRAAALLLGKKWNGPGRLNAAAGVVLKDNPRGGGHTMLQADPDGRWMFVHANLIKHTHFSRPLWGRVQRVAQDRYEDATTYGSILPANKKLGEGVKLRVDQEPKLVTAMEVFEGYDEALVVVEEWDAYEELRGFEEKWFGFGGVH